MTFFNKFFILFFNSLTIALVQVIATIQEWSPRFTNHCDRDLRPITLFGFTVITTGSKNTDVLLNKICTTWISTSSVFSSLPVCYKWQLAHVFCIDVFLGCLLYLPMWESLTHLVITWPNGIVWSTLTIFFLPVAIVKRRSNQHLLWNQITVVPALNIPDSFQACNLFNSKSLCVFQPDREHLTSNFNLFLSLKVKSFHRLHISRKSVGCHCCKPPPYAFWGSCTFGKTIVNARKLVWLKENSHW